MLNIKSLVSYVTLAVMSFASLAKSQDVISFDRSSFGKAVWSQTESTVTDVQLELSIGDYKNEPIINYSDRSDLVQFGRSVGRLDVLTDKGIHRCTAFIVSKQYILTNYHCSLGVLENDRLGATRIEAITFIAGYTQTGVEEGTRKYVTHANAVEFNKQLDYAVLEVIGDPSAEYGELKLASLAPQSGDPFWIIGHPMGEGQRVSREKCRASEPAVSVGKLLHTCDTLPGNSGSPVIDISLRQVVALHHAGSKKDSVNFAILMSEILKNSRVLSAYKAPISVNPLTPKITEMTACDTLYSAAAEAKACYAYQAFFKSCKNHPLKPIAEGYIKEFCQVQDQDIVEVENTLQNQGVPEATKKCGITPASCSNIELCHRATEDGKQWRDRFGANAFTKFVNEAKLRNLECAEIYSFDVISSIDKYGLSFGKFPPQPSLTAAPVFDVKELQKENTSYALEMREGPNFNGKYFLLPYGCGSSCKFYSLVDLTNGKVFSFPFGGEKHWNHDIIFDESSSLLKIIYPRNDYDKKLYHCVIEEVSWNEKTTKFHTENEYLFPVFYGDECYNTPDWNHVKIDFGIKTCSKTDPAECEDLELCNFATSSYGVPNGPKLWEKYSGYQVYVNEAKRRGLSCGVVEIAVTNLKQAFVSQSKLKRRQLQYALKKLGYYSFGIDGLWGKGTSSGFDKFVKRDGLQSKTEAQVFSSLLSKVSVPSSFKQKPIILGKNWALGFVCSGTLASGKALFYNRKDLDYETRYTISYSDNSGKIHEGLLKITGTKMRFRMENAKQKIVTTGSGKFNSSYSRAEGKSSGNCRFYASKS